MNIQGHTHLPAVLVDDDSRAAVAGLGPSVSDWMFSPIRDREEVSALSMAQSIVTTTTGSPDEVRTEPR